MVVEAVGDQQIDVVAVVRAGRQAGAAEAGQAAGTAGAGDAGQGGAGPFDDDGLAGGAGQRHVLRGRFGGKRGAEAAGQSQAQGGVLEQLTEMHGLTRQGWRASNKARNCGLC